MQPQEALPVAHTVRRFGAYDMTVFVDGVFEAPTEVLIHADGEAARQRVIDG